MFWHRLRTGLLVQFGIVSLLVVLTLGAGIGWMLGRIVEQEALADTAADASDAVSMLATEHLSPEDLLLPMTGQRYESFRRVVQLRSIPGRTARIKLWARDGTIIFSDEASLVGQRFPVSGELAEALEGKTATELSDLHLEENVAERQQGRLLEVYVPVVFPGSSTVEGAFEVYQYYEPVAIRIRAAQHSLYLALSIGLLLLYGTLFTVVKRGHDTIIRQQSRLASMVAEKASLLDAVQEHSAALQQRNEQLASLHRFTTGLSQCTALPDVLSTGLRLAEETIGVEEGVIWLVEPEGNACLGAHLGLTEEHGAILTSRLHGDGALQRVSEAGQPVVAGRAEICRLGISAGQAHLLPNGGLFVPLLSRGTVLGVLTLYSVAGEGCDQADRQLAQALGSALGVAVENVRRYEEARDLADHDPVTGLLNHRAFHRRLEEEFHRAQRGGHALSVIMMDLDGFKLFNDTYGHPVGDRVLREVATILGGQVRSGDVLGRYGGDEFVALMPETEASGGLAAAERFCAALAEHSYVHQDGPAVPIRMSLGVASYPEYARHSNELLSLADANLYASKQQGGNTVTGGDSASEQDGVPISGYFGVLDGLVTAVDNKDHYTRQHSEEVTNYALSIAQALGLSEESQRTLRIAGVLHDVGKIGVPDRILRKPGRLDEEELNIIRQHAALGEMIIKEVPNISDVVAAVGAHHERYDGQGYPRGLKGDEIPLLGRILAVADAYSAMTTDRPYRKALSPAVARAELLRAAGNQLDPRLVEIFVRLLSSASLATEATNAA